MAELAHAAGVIGGNMALAAQPVAVGHQTLQSNGAAGGMVWVEMPTSAPKP